MYNNYKYMGEWSVVWPLQSRIFTFIDFYKNKVEFSYDLNPFSNNPRHVWVLCKYNEEWLLTGHEGRGIEFPGGKVEIGESPEEAAQREVYEETGGILKSLTYIGQYRVIAKQEIVVKNVYFAIIKRLEERDHYFETEGPILLKKLPHDIKTNRQYSFIMKDEVLSLGMQWVEKNVK